MSAPEFDGWRLTVHGGMAFYSRSHGKRTAVVTQLDGFNWGWIVGVEAGGKIVDGRCSGTLDPWTAVAEADAALGVRQPQPAT